LWLHLVCSSVKPSDSETRSRSPRPYCPATIYPLSARTTPNTSSTSQSSNVVPACATHGETGPLRIIFQPEHTPHRRPSAPLACARQRPATMSAASVFSAFTTEYKKSPIKLKVGDWVLARARSAWIKRWAGAHRLAHFGWRRRAADLSSPGARADHRPVPRLCRRHCPRPGGRRAAGDRLPQAPMALARSRVAERWHSLTS
jgi:hypothetical protein